MAIVYESRESGALVRIVDDAYRGCSEEELERRRQETRKVAGRILARLMMEGKI